MEHIYVPPYVISVVVIWLLNHCIRGNEDGEVENSAPQNMPNSALIVFNCYQISFPGDRCDRARLRKDRDSKRACFPRLRRPSTRERQKRSIGLHVINIFTRFREKMGAIDHRAAGVSVAITRRS